jgi:hypothetical protein
LAIEQDEQIPGEQRHFDAVDQRADDAVAALDGDEWQEGLVTGAA